MNSNRHALRRWRQANGVSLKELRALVDLSEGFLSDLENGKKFARAENIARLCAVTGLNADDFLPRSEA